MNPPEHPNFQTTSDLPDGVVSFYTGTADELEKIGALLRSGEVVAIPTETVYGLAANALDPAACARIFAIKGRPLIDPLIVHVDSVERAKLLAHWTPLATRLTEAFWPGPLTIILGKRPVVPDIVTAGQSSVALRQPAHPLARAVLVHSGCPLAAPSANPFGYLSPTEAGHVAASLGGRVRHILDGGPCALGVESTIVDLRRPDHVRILRPGSITQEALENLLHQPIFFERHASARPEAPGMLERHYSPRTPLYLHPHGRLPSAGPREAVVCLARPPLAPPPEGPEFFWLSENGDLEICLRALYALLHRLDCAGHAGIHCESAPETGLGLTFNDRLRRAAAR